MQNFFTSCREMRKNLPRESSVHVHTSLLAMCYPAGERALPADLTKEVYMKRKSHKLLGLHLVGQLQDAPKRRHVKAFLLGCTEPDCNPFTYLKGSRTCQWLRGHNYRNAESWMERMSGRLAGRENWRVLDYYRLGKLIHYTSDAFTHAHNETFRENIRCHRSYEAQLQHCLLSLLTRETGRRTGKTQEGKMTMESVRKAHRDFMKEVRCVATDAEYILRMTEQVFGSLIPQPISAEQ